MQHRRVGEMDFQNGRRIVTRGRVAFEGFFRTAPEFVEEVAIRLYPQRDERRYDSMRQR